MIKTLSSQILNHGRSQHYCVAGVDLVPGHEGGSWLGMSKTGRLGALTNILAKRQSNKKSRGTSFA